MGSKPNRMWGKRSMLPSIRYLTGSIDHYFEITWIALVHDGDDTWYWFLQETRALLRWNRSSMAKAREKATHFDNAFGQCTIVGHCFAAYSKRWVKDLRGKKGKEISCNRRDDCRLKCVNESLFDHLEGKKTSCWMHGFLLGEENGRKHRQHQYVNVVYLLPPSLIRAT